MRNSKKLFLLSGLLSVLFACGGGGGGSTPPPPPPAPTPLSVSSVNPTNNATSVPVTTKVTFVFSASLDPGTVTASSVTLLANNVVVPATVSTSNATVTLTPSAPLNYSSVYTTKVLTSVKNTSGTALSAQFSSSFTTASYVDTTPPTVVSVNPTTNATNVPISTSVSVTFSEPVAESSVNATSCELLLGAVQVSASISFDTTGKVVTLTPASPLAYASTYSVVLTTSVTDLAGNALASQFSSSFVTAAAPPPAFTPFGLDTQYQMDTVAADETGNVFVSGHTTATPTNAFVAKFDSTGKLLVLNSNLGLAAGFYPYGNIYVHGGNAYVPVKNDAPNSIMVAKLNADTLNTLVFASVHDGSKPSVVADNSGNLFITSYDMTMKTDLFFAPEVNISYAGGTSIALAFNGVIVAGKTNTVTSVTRRDLNLAVTWNEVSSTSGCDVFGTSSSAAASMFYVSGTTFDATVSNATHYPFVKGYKYQNVGGVETISLSWNTALAGTDMMNATGGSDGSHYAVCAGPDVLYKVLSDGTLAWTAPLARKSYGVAEYNGTVFVSDMTNVLTVMNGQTGARQ